VIKLSPQPKVVQPGQMVLVSVSRGDMVVRACVLEVANERVSAFIIQFLLSVKLCSLTFAWYQLKLTFPIYCLYCPTSSSYIYLFWSINTIVIINQCSDQDSLVESSKFHIAAYDSSVYVLMFLDQLELPVNSVWLLAVRLRQKIRSVSCMYGVSKFLASMPQHCLHR
jgi:hypothetical protein